MPKCYNRGFVPAELAATVDAESLGTLRIQHATNGEVRTKEPSGVELFRFNMTNEHNKEQIKAMVYSSQRDAIALTRNDVIVLADELSKVDEIYLSAKDAVISQGDGFKLYDEIERYLSERGTKVNMNELTDITYEVFQNVRKSLTEGQK